MGNWKVNSNPEFLLLTAGNPENTTGFEPETCLIRVYYFTIMTPRSVVPDKDSRMMQK